MKKVIMLLGVLTIGLFFQSFTDKKTVKAETVKTTEINQLNTLLTPTSLITKVMYKKKGDGEMCNGTWMGRTFVVKEHKNGDYTITLSNKYGDDVVQQFEDSYGLSAQAHAATFCRKNME